MIDRAARFEVPYGSFEGVTHLQVTLSPRLADAGLTELWLVPGVGIAAWTEQSIAGPRTDSLVSFANRFEPVPVPEPDRVRISLDVDRAVYEISDSVVVDYVLRNVSEDAVRIVFSSGQRYDLALASSRSDERIWTWSMDKLFDQSTKEITVAPGGSYTFREVIQLSGLVPLDCVQGH